MAGTTEILDSSEKIYRELNESFTKGTNLSIMTADTDGKVGGYCACGAELAFGLVYYGV